MLTLVANTMRSHGGVEMRFVDKAPTTNTDTRSVVNAAEHLDIPNRVHHWFRGGHVCRLCNAMHAKPKEHFQSGVEARHHVVKEVFLSYWMEEDKKGIPFSGTRLWERRLQKKRMDQKLFIAREEMMKTCLKDYQSVILDSSSSSSTSSLSSSISHLRKKNIQDRCLFLYCVLHFLKESHVLGASLSPARPSPSELKSKFASNEAIGRTYTKAVRNTVRFESLEYWGDCMWSFEASARIMYLMPHRDWLSFQHAWAAGILRDGIESNDNLMKLAELIFDLKEEYDDEYFPFHKRLKRIDKMFPADVILGGGKPFADVLEAVMGELHSKLFELESAPPQGVSRNYAVGHLYFNGLNPCNQSEKVLANVVRFAIDEINDLAALNFGYNHVGFDAETRMVPFMKELLHSSVQMRIPENGSTAFSGEKRERTSNIFFRGRRLRGMMNNNNEVGLGGGSSTSSTSSLLSALNPNSNSNSSSNSIFAPEFTFIDYKLHEKKTSLKKQQQEEDLDYSKDRLRKSFFTNAIVSEDTKRISSVDDNNEQQQNLGSYSMKEISRNSFDRAIDDLLSQYPGEASLSSTTMTEYHDDDNHENVYDSHRILAKKAREDSLLQRRNQNDRIRLETFAFDCLPKLTLVERQKKKKKNLEDEDDNNYEDEVQEEQSSVSSNYSSPRAFALRHPPITEGSCWTSSSSSGSSSLSQYQPPDLSRVFPADAPFESNTGNVPQIVLDVEAKRTALVEKRKKMRRMRRI